MRHRAVLMQTLPAVIIISCCLWIAVPVSALTSERQFGAGGKQVPVETLDEFPTAKSFFLRYGIPQRPVAIRNGAKHSPALQLWRTDDYLLSTPEKVAAAKAQMVTVESLKKEVRGAPTWSTPFYEFLQSYRDTNIYMVEELPQYLAPDVVMPYPLQCAELSNSFLQAQTWFSSGGTASVAHTDDADNLLCVYDGQKEVIIVDPHKYGHIVPVDSSSGAVPIDVDDADPVKWPGLDEVEYIVANLSTGDCLFIPFRWIHQVRSHNRNIGVNVWWNHHDNKYFELNACRDDFDPTLTFDRFQFQGFNAQLRNPDAVQSLIKDMLDTGEDIYSFIVGDDSELSDSRKKLLRELSDEVFHYLDVNKDGKVTAPEISDITPENWSEVQRLLMELQNMPDEVLDELQENIASSKSEL